MSIELKYVVIEIRDGGTVVTPEAGQSLRVANLSRSNAIDIYIDGRQPTIEEQHYGSKRETLRVFPGGWAIFPVFQDVAIAPAGYCGEWANQDPPYAQTAGFVPITVQELGGLYPYQAYDPEESLIANMQHKEITPRGSDPYYWDIRSFDPDFFLPQVTEKLIGVIYEISETPGGTDGFNYLVIEEDTGATSYSNVITRRIPLAGYSDLFTNDNIGRGLVYFRTHGRLRNLSLTTTETGGRLVSFRMWYCKRPREERAQTVLRDWPAIAASGVKTIYPRTAQHLEKITVSWAQAGAAAGTIVATHYGLDGTARGPVETASMVGASNGAVDFEPRAAFIGLVITAGSADVADVTVSESRDYRI